MSDCRTRIARISGPARPRGGGFTLLEVMLAMAILALCVVPLLGSITQGLRAASRIERITTASELARNKLAELELETVTDIEETREGVFDPPHEDFAWQAVFSKRPELEMLEEQISGLKTMELRLRVVWLEGGAEQAVEFSTLLVQ